MKQVGIESLRSFGVLCGLIAGFNIVGTIIMTLQFQGWPSRKTKDIALVTDVVLNNLRNAYLTHIILAVTMSVLTVIVFAFVRKLSYSE